MKILLERKKCIGCGNCLSVCPKFFEMAEDGRSHLKNSKINAKNGDEELEVNEKSCFKEAEEICPVKCIHIDIK